MYLEIKGIGKIIAKTKKAEEIIEKYEQGDRVVSISGMLNDEENFDFKSKDI